MDGGVIKKRYLTAAGRARRPRSEDAANGMV